MHSFLCIALGLFVGCLSGALGIGGGVVLIPALMLLFGFNLRKATATSIAILVPPVGLPAAWHYYKENQVDVTVALLTAAGFAAGAYLGAYLVSKHYVPESALRFVFGLFLLYVAMRYLINSDSEAHKGAAGLAAVAVAWISFVAVRTLGRKHARPRPLGEQIRAAEVMREGDYQI